MPESEQFLYMIRPIRVAMLTADTTEQESRILEQHFTYLKDLTEKGIVLLAGRTLTQDETSFGIVVFRADSALQAQDIMQNDPAVQHGVMHAKLYPYRVALQGR